MKKITFESESLNEPFLVKIDDAISTQEKSEKDAAATENLKLAIKALLDRDSRAAWLYLLKVEKAYDTVKGRTQYLFEDLVKEIGRYSKEYKLIDEVEFLNDKIEIFTAWKR